MLHGIQYTLLHRTIKTLLSLAGYLWIASPLSWMSYSTIKPWLCLLNRPCTFFLLYLPHQLSFNLEIFSSISQPYKLCSSSKKSQIKPWLRDLSDFLSHNELHKENQRCINLESTHKSSSFVVKLIVYMSSPWSIGSNLYVRLLTASDRNWTPLEAYV